MIWGVVSSVSICLFPIFIPAGRVTRWFVVFSTSNVVRPSETVVREFGNVRFFLSIKASVGTVIRGYRFPLLLGAVNRHRGGVFCCERDGSVNSEKSFIFGMSDRQ